MSRPATTPLASDRARARLPLRKQRCPAAVAADAHAAAALHVSRLHVSRIAPGPATPDTPHPLNRVWQEAVARTTKLLAQCER
jgi:hypothetical protein